MGSGPNCYQIGNKTCYTPKLANVMSKNDIYVNNLQKVTFDISICILQTQKIISREDPHGTEFGRS